MQRRARRRPVRCGSGRTVRGTPNCPVPVIIVTATPDELRVDPSGQLAAIGQAVITVDLDGLVIYWNPAAEMLYGWTANEAIGWNLASLLVPGAAKEMGADISAALRDGTPWSGAFPVRRKDGSTFPALVTDSGIYRDGVLVGIIGLSTNLGTALRPMLERSTDAALVMRADGTLTYASPAVKQLFGWSDEDIIGTSIIPLIHPEDRPVLGQFLGELEDQPGAHPPVELRVKSGDDWVWAEAALTNLLDDPTVRGVVCNLRPSVRLTAQHEAENTARQLQAALDSRLIIERAKGFLAGRLGIGVDAAFDLLRRYARSNHLTIHDVSRRVATGDLALTTSPTNQTPRATNEAEGRCMEATPRPDCDAVTFAPSATSTRQGRERSPTAEVSSRHKPPLRGQLRCPGVMREAEFGTSSMAPNPSSTTTSPPEKPMRAAIRPHPAVGTGPRKRRGSNTRRGGSNGPCSSAPRADRPVPAADLNLLADRPGLAGLRRVHEEPANEGPGQSWPHAQPN